MSERTLTKEEVQAEQRGRDDIMQAVEAALHAVTCGALVACAHDKCIGARKLASEIQARALALTRRSGSKDTEA